jgi:hypothetical protein
VDRKRSRFVMWRLKKRREIRLPLLTIFLSIIMPFASWEASSVTYHVFQGHIKGQGRGL